MPEILARQDLFLRSITFVILLFTFFLKKLEELAGLGLFFYFIYMYYIFQNIILPKVNSSKG